MATRGARAVAWADAAPLHHETQPAADDARSFVAESTKRAAQTRNGLTLRRADGFSTFLPSTEDEAFGRALGLTDERLAPQQDYVDAVTRFVAVSNLAPSVRAEFSMPDAPVALPEAWENTRIPAAYTYFLQFIAHDLVDSDYGASILLRTRTKPRNLRRVRLQLESIYGAGPETEPSLYWCRAFQSNDTPRCELALGRMRPAPAPGLENAPPGAFRDLPRAAPLDAEGENASSPRLVDVRIADARNDDNALVAQVTTMFHIAHNTLVRTINEHGRMRRGGPVAAQESFEIAQAALTLVYRNIIRKDVLRRILHPRVRELYVDRGLRLVDDPGEAIAIEFTHGAFRFAHAMVRNQYQMNERPHSRFEISQVLRQTSSRLGAAMPLDANWIVDWAQFLPLGEQRPLYSRRLAWPYTPPLNDAEELADLMPRGIHSAGGLMLLDLLSHAASGATSLPALRRLVRERAARSGALGLDLVDLLDAEAGPVGFAAADSGTGVFADEARAFLRLTGDDTPLPLFFVLEAMHGGGRHLGALGSVIVAETLLGAMEADPVRLVETDDAPLPRQLAELGGRYGLDGLAALIGEPMRRGDWDDPFAPGALAAPDAETDDEIATLAQFVRFVARTRSPDGTPFAAGA